MWQGQVEQKGKATWGRQLLAWSAVMSYCGLLYYLSDQPRLRLPQVVSSSDTLVHVSAYAVLGWLWTVALRETWEGCSSLAVVLFALLFTLGYGLSDEWHQSFVPGRVSSTVDVVADVIGGGLGAGSFFLWTRRRAREEA
jgi:VanZ family protein